MNGFRAPKGWWRPSRLADLLIGLLTGWPCTWDWAVPQRVLRVYVIGLPITLPLAACLLLVALCLATAEGLVVGVIYYIRSLWNGGTT